MSTQSNLPLNSSAEREVFTVSEFLDFLNELISYRSVVVQGEIGEKMGNYPRFSFFNLLDKDGSVLNCFSFRWVIDKLGVGLEPGMEIKVIGYPQVRKNRGALNFQVKSIELVGEGVLKKQFEILKKKLAGEGYFEEKFKKDIPRFPQNIGLITSKHGRGAKKDFLNNLGEFGFNISFYNVKVDSEFAVYDIKKAVKWFNQNLPEVEVIVIVRGGGDWESLKAFNSEELVKQIFSSNIPVIAGIGHEDDNTLVDFVADRRASTPTHTAKILNESWEFASNRILEIENNIHSYAKSDFRQLKEKVNMIEKDIGNVLERKISSLGERFDYFANNLTLYLRNSIEKFKRLEEEFKRNQLKIESLQEKHRIRTDEYLKKLVKAQKEWEEKLKNHFRRQEEKLSLSSPELKLKQGYSITRDKFGKIIKDIKQLKVGEIITTNFLQGSIDSKVKNKSLFRNKKRDNK